MGATLYPQALEYLEALRISQIFNLMDWNDGKPLGGVSNLNELKERLPALYTGLPSFECVINPQIPFGTDRVIIRMGWSSGDDFVKDTPNYSPRSITVSAKFDDPTSARRGLKGLKDLYTETVLKERLFAVELPEDVANLYKRGLDYLHQHLLYDHGFIGGEAPQGEYDSETYQAWQKEAWIGHVKFLIPVWKRLGLNPQEISYYYFKANLSYREPAPSLEDVLGVVADKSFDGSRLPYVDAEFNGRQVKVDMAIPYGVPDLGIGVLDYAMRMQTEGQEGVLEDFLERVQKC